jgi:hypothetical protein
MCCKVMPVPEVEKPVGKWCRHCKIGEGCTIYETRPQPCKDFECYWLQSPPDVMGDSLRPDRCGVVISGAEGGSGVAALCDPDRPAAWRNPHVLKILRQMAKAGWFVAARSGKRFWAIGTRGDHEVGPEGQTPTSATLTMLAVPAQIANDIGFMGSDGFKFRGHTDLAKLLK